MRSELVQLGRGNIALSFHINLVPCVEDAAFHARVDTLTVSPCAPEPGGNLAGSHAAPARWNRRLAPVDPARVFDLSSSETALFTVFDPVHHVRTFRRDISDTDDVLIAKAISVTPEILDAEGFTILHGVDELPRPQFVLKSRATTSWVVPLLFQQRPIAICTVEVPPAASAFDVALLASKACPAVRGAHHQVARRTACIVGHHGSSDPYRTGCVSTHEALILRSFSAAAARQRASQSRRYEGTIDWVEARQPESHEDFSDIELSKIRFLLQGMFLVQCMWHPQQRCDSYVTTSPSTGLQVPLLPCAGLQYVQRCPEPSLLRC